MGGPGVPPFRTLILGHRGAPRVHPENTMASFARALELGADGVELDVQRSRDGVPVVIHDGSLDRTRQGRGAIDALSWAELSASMGPGGPVPSLAAAAAWASRTGAWLNVEIKATDVTAETLAVLAEAGLGPRLILSSFHAAVVAEAGRVAPHLTRYLLLDGWADDGLETVRGCDAQGVCLRLDAADDDTLATLDAAGLPVVVWTVDVPVEVARLVARGVRAIITNRPELAVAIRG